jgi:hypothetical protein
MWTSSRPSPRSKDSWIYVDRDQKYLLLLPGDSATAHIRQPHRFADDHDEPVIFTIKTEPAGGVVKAFQLA